MNENIIISTKSLLKKINYRRVLGVLFFRLQRCTLSEFFPNEQCKQGHSIQNKSNSCVQAHLVQNQIVCSIEILKR